MTFEDSINWTKVGVSVAAAEKSLARAREAFGEARFGMLRSERSGGKVSIVYGVSGRALDAKALSYELNN